MAGKWRIGVPAPGGTVRAWECKDLLEVFKDLKIDGVSADLNAFIDAVTAELPTEWSRDEERENQLKETAASSDEYQYTFTRSASAGMPAASLFMIRSGSSLKVTNIVPKEVGSLSRMQYNTILDEFVAHIARSAADRLNLTIELTPDHLPITHWLSGDTARQLKSFSGAANKSTGSSHPSDFKRWTAFLIQAHREHTNLDTETLQRWLIEEEGWPEDRAVDLAKEFEFARDLLRAYDEE